MEEDKRKDREQVLLNTEMHVYIQMTKDLLQEFCNMEEAKDARYETATAYEAFNQFRKKMKRMVGEHDLELFEDIVGDMADDIAPQVEWGKGLLRTLLVNRLPWNQIETGVIFSMMGGFLSRAVERHMALFGKTSSNLATAYKYLKQAEMRLQFRTLNEGQEVDFAACRKEMEKIYARVRQTIEASM